MLFVTDTATQIAIMTELAAVGGEFNGLTLRLFVNDYNPTKATVLADLTEASATWGYAAVAAQVFGVGFVDVDGRVVLTAPSVDYITDDITLQEVVYGWYLTDAAGTLYKGAARLDAPVPVGEFLGQGLIVQPRIPYGG